MEMDNRLDMYTKIVPNDRQKAFCETGFHAFFHYGMNTFTGKEWGDGKDSPSNFNPKNQNTDQWVEAVKNAGAKGVIITAKHHDGFCLWQTKTTEYSVKNSPYKNGNGDVVKEVSESCEKYGMKFGFYLSPWDRNSEFYGTPKYNDFYMEQLTELLTNYGEVFCVWLDGACGSYMDGKDKQVYDFERLFKTVYEHQPNCAISNCGPDIRWVGNEGGYARKSEWNVVPEFSFDVQTIADSSQKADDAEFRKKGADVIASDLGSREFLSHYNSFIWYPAEVDVSIRPGWFYHEKEDKRVRSLNNLLNIYYNSVGGNSLLLLNVPPNKDGLVADVDVERLAMLGEEIEKGTANSVKIASYKAPKAGEGSDFQSIISKDGFYTPDVESEKYEFALKFQTPQTIDKLLLKEDCDFSQRVEAFDIYALVNGKEKKLYSGTTIGFKRYALFQKAVTVQSVRIVITQCRKKPYLKNISVLSSGGQLPKEAWYAPVVKIAHKINYMVYITMENIKGKK